jgi:gamma-D-glutamyl-L-lysine dipeptidyl-peptidase
MRNYAFIFQAMAPLRAQASDASEMVSQLLFGDVVDIVARDRQWLQVCNQADHYTGWMDEKAALAIDEDWLAQVSEWVYVQEDLLTLTTTRAGATLPLRLGLGASIPLPSKGGRVEIGDWTVDVQAYVPRAAGSLSADRVVQLSERYLGSPYLWGGKTLWGIDCSGLTQMVFAMAGKLLPRDAKDQAQLGTEVPFAARASGDLAFFMNATGKVHHVGIILPDGNIRHASGHVHDSVLLEGGIVGKYTGQQTHRLCSIKRIV